MFQVFFLLRKHNSFGLEMQMNAGISSQTFIQLQYSSQIYIYSARNNTQSHLSKCNSQNNCIAGRTLFKLSSGALNSTLHRKRGFSDLDLNLEKSTVAELWTINTYLTVNHKASTTQIADSFWVISNTVFKIVTILVHTANEYFV